MALNPGDTAIVTTATDPSINFRGDPSTNNAPIGQLARGLAVLITGAPVGAFFPVRTPDGQSGWAGGAYLIAAPVAVAPPAPTPPTVTPTIPAEVILDPNLPPVASSSRLPIILGGGVLLLLVAAAAMSKKKGAPGRARARR